MVGFYRYIYCITLGVLLTLWSTVEVKASTDCSIRIGSTGGQIFGPLEMRYYAEHSIGRDIHLGLFDLDSSERAVPMLAKSWVIDEENKILTISLDTSCGWSDGKRVTAEEMVDGILLAFKHPNTFFAGRQFFHNGSAVLAGEKPLSDLHVIAVDDSTIEIMFVGPEDLILKSLSYSGYMPSPNHIIRDQQTDWPPKDKMSVVTSGAYYPYSLTDTTLELRENPYYCSGFDHSIDKVMVSFKSSFRDMLSAFITGEIDLMYNVPERHMRSLNHRSAKGKFKIGNIDSFVQKTVQYLFVNQLHTALQDSKVKEAIKLLIDHELFLSSSMLGDSAVMATGYTNRYFDYNPKKYDFGSEDYQQRIKKARSLMADAGYSDGNQLVLDMPSRNGHYFYSMSNALKGMLRQGYIELQLRDTKDTRDYYGNLQNASFDLMFGLWRPDVPDPSSYFEALLDGKFLEEDLYKDLKAELADTYLINNRSQRFAALAALEDRVTNIGHIIPLYENTMNWALKDSFMFRKLSGTHARNLDKKQCLDEQAS